MAISARALDALRIVRIFILIRVENIEERGDKSTPWATLRTLEDPKNRWGRISERTIEPLIRAGYLVKTLDIRPGVEEYGLTALGESIIKEHVAKL